jgi:zinc transport system permease protein
MNPYSFLDPLFHIPFATGLILACALPVLGALLMLREEWLAALGLAHLAAAGALAGAAMGWPMVAGGVVAALGGGTAKALLRARGNVAYALMMLGGWSALLLIAANTAAGEALGRALIEGQLYFAGAVDLVAAALLAGITLVALHRLMVPLLRARLFPRLDAANRQPVRRRQLGFDLLTATAVAVATAAIGLMAGFALVLIPAGIAFRLAPGWRWTLVLGAVIGVGSYGAAFAAALVLDQPFGPVLVAVLLAVATIAASLRAAIARLLPPWHRCGTYETN